MSVTALSARPVKKFLGVSIIPANIGGKREKMPGLIAVSEFVEETREDYNSPTTSTFVSRMPQCRQTITSLEEVNLFIWFLFLNESNQIFSCFAFPNVTLQKFWSVVERVFQCVGVSQSLHGCFIYLWYKRDWCNDFLM